MIISRDTKICLCKDTMIKLVKHLRKTKSGKTLLRLIVKRTASQFPKRKSRRMKRPISPLALAMTQKSKKTMRKKPRTAKQKAATRKLVAFNKKRFR